MTDAYKPLVLKWAWRHYSLYVDDVFDDLDQAINMAGYAADDGAESLVGIEAWDDDGYRYLDADTVFGIYEKRRLAAARAAPPPPKPIVGIIEIKPPEGTSGVGGLGQADWTTYSSYHSEDRLHAELARLQSVLGDRVRRRDPKK